MIIVATALNAVESLLKKKVISRFLVDQIRTFAFATGVESKVLLKAIVNSVWLTSSAL